MFDGITIGTRFISLDEPGEGGTFRNFNVRGGSSGMGDTFCILTYVVVHLKWSISKFLQVDIFLNSHSTRSSHLSHTWLVMWFTCWLKVFKYETKSPDDLAIYRNSADNPQNSCRHSFTRWLRYMRSCITLRSKFPLTITALPIQLLVR